ncbi:unnamed protein product [Caenorhabditis bovis]|uniref:Uncharacterized protein n=1 Tax=Caenorhabditis bovis TaxID=2654633 RepID=A0A8S1EU08_9PELO|nr:unnamed protein product [Caenorhabditis bovis]
MSEALNDNLFQRLFRIFSQFVDRNVQGTFKPTQAEFIIDEMLKELHRPTSPKNVDLPENVTFSEFLSLVQAIFPDREELEITTERVFERFANHVIGKGFIMYRNLAGRAPKCFPFKIGDKWKFGWILIMPGRVRMKSENSDDEIVVNVDNEAIIEVNTQDDERYSWTIVTEGQEWQFSHFDRIQATLMLKDMRLARDYPTRESLLDYDWKRSQRGRPIQDKLAREQKRRDELENERKRLVSELEEERKNRMDEEIVRGLTTRLLKQEMEKSEQMQQVIYELRTKLHEDPQEHEMDYVEGEYIKEK